MPIRVGIDGTGSRVNPGQERNLRYFEEFKNTFVSRICRAKPNSKYLAGPVLLGGGLPEAITAGVKFIEEQVKKPGNKQPVLLTGYSRGGLGVIVIAEELKKKNINVEAMLLFDAVDRHGGFNAASIPNNVANVLHNIRDPLSSSRESFGNCGLQSTAPTNYPTPTKYMCTHGGMGGAPWLPAKGQAETDFIDEEYYDGWTKITFKQDAFVSNKIWQDCQPFMAKYGFV
ncbi:hypothetical protein BH20ACI1_BH20ACI1_00340 [soil metagenome]